MVIWRGLGVAALVRTMERLAGEPASPPVLLFRDEDRSALAARPGGRERPARREGEG